MTSNYFGTKIKGPKLPKKGTIGKICVLYDGKSPSQAGSGAKGTKYKTDGNIQVFVDDMVRKYLKNNNLNI